MKVSALFTTTQQTAITEAIRRAESVTSIEIRVHLESHCPLPVLDRAVAVFQALEMEKTAARNGILIYLAVKDHVSAILGDLNVNNRVHPGFWQECSDAMAVFFSRADYAGGICRAIEKLEEELKTSFPHQTEDVNELSDEISFGE